MFDDLGSLADGALLLALAAAALLEYLFPPFPGDTVSVLGGALVASRGGSLVALVAAMSASSLLGMAVLWRVGAGLGAGLEARPPEATVWGVPVASLRRGAAFLQRHGAWVLVGNRFLPTFRAILFLAAGAAGLGLPRVLVLGGLSAVAWNTLLVALGVSLGANRERIEAWLLAYKEGALVVLLGVALVLLGRWWWRRRAGP